MIDSSTAAAVWGELSRTPTEAVHALGLTGRAAEILADIGLPRTAEPFFTSAALTLLPQPGSTGTRIRFGTDLGTSLIVQVPDGPVVSVPDPAGAPTRYVNADLASYAEFLLETCRSWRTFPGLDDEQIDTRIDALEQHLLSVDPTAFGNPAHCWPVVFEQLRDGLL